MRIARTLRRLVSHRPRHAEVDQEHTIGFEPDNQILAAPLDGRDGLSLQLRRDLAWLDGARHARIEDLDTVELPADEDGLEANSNRLDSGSSGTGQPSRGLVGQVYVSVSRMTPPGGGASSASS